MSDKLWLPKQVNTLIHEQYPNGLPPKKRFKKYMFTCHYDSDVYDFHKLLKEKGATYCGVIMHDFLNAWNMPIGKNEYTVIYYYTEEINMEVLC